KDSNNIFCHDFIREHENKENLNQLASLFPAECYTRADLWNAIPLHCALLTNYFTFKRLDDTTLLDMAKKGGAESLIVENYQGISPLFFAAYNPDYVKVLMGFLDFY